MANVPSLTSRQVNASQTTMSSNACLHLRFVHKSLSTRGLIRATETLWWQAGVARGLRDEDQSRPCADCYLIFLLLRSNKKTNNNLHMVDFFITAL